MSLVKSFGVVLVALIIAACAGPAPKGSSLDATVSKTLHIGDVRVDVSGMGGQTKGRPVSASTVESILKSTATETLKGAGSGARSADVEIALSSVDIISGGRAMFIGGESIMKGQFRLRDSVTGEVLIPATEIESGGGGWVLGGIVAAASLDDPRTELRELSQKFADRINIAVFGL